MDTASVEFIAFGVLVAILSNWSRSSTWRGMVLLASSTVFIVILSPSARMLLPFAAFLALGYVTLMLLERGWPKARKWFIGLAIIAYVWLKAYSFLPDAMLLHFPYFTLGLSYIFFRVLQLLIEAEKREEAKPMDLAAYATYLLNFTTFISGPIQSYKEFAASEFAVEPPRLGARVVFLQIERIIRGFFKVNVLAMLFHLIQVQALDEMSATALMSAKIFAALRLVVVYPFFLYANFSGYIDIVIALARLMRLRLPENFDRPLSATSFLDFWNRWHITLSKWFKTYVYNPMLIVLMRRFPSPALEPWLGVLCFFITFFLVGVWHGRTSVFVFYGLLQGGGISINKLWQIVLTRAMGRKGYKKLAANPVYEIFSRGLTFSWFALTLFWFWGTWQQIEQLAIALTVTQWLGVWGAVWLLASMLLSMWEVLRNAILSIGSPDEPLFTGRYGRVVYASAMALVSLVMSIVLNQAAPDIVYKAF